jgi:hypothetical protein
MRLNLDFSLDKCELFQAKLHFSKQKLLFSNPFRRVQIGRNCESKPRGDSLEYRRQVYASSLVFFRR